MRNDVRAAGARDRIDRIVGGLPWARLCPVGPVDLLFVAAEAVAATERCGVVAVFARPDGAVLDAAVRAGARGLILADDPAEDFRRSIHDVLHRGGWVSPRLAGRLLARFPMGAPEAEADPAAVLTPLTTRERQALRLLAEGRENAEIAALMFVSVSAVKYHVSNLLRKFGCRDRTQLLAHLNRVGLRSVQL